ncbi:MAG: hypothetical protein ACRD3W_26145 [Terriglobales bacterium]
MNAKDDDLYSRIMELIGKSIHDQGFKQLVSDLGEPSIVDDEAYHSYEFRDTGFAIWVNPETGKVFATHFLFDTLDIRKGVFMRFPGSLLNGIRCSELRETVHGKMGGAPKRSRVQKGVTDPSRWYQIDSYDSEDKVLDFGFNAETQDIAGLRIINLFLAPSLSKS